MDYLEFIVLFAGIVFLIWTFYRLGHVTGQLKTADAHLKFLRRLAVHEKCGDVALEWWDDEQKMEELLSR